MATPAHLAGLSEVALRFQQRRQEPVDATVERERRQAQQGPSDPVQLALKSRRRAIAGEESDDEPDAHPRAPVRQQPASARRSSLYSRARRGSVSLLNLHPPAPTDGPAASVTAGSQAHGGAAAAAELLQAGTEGSGAWVWMFDPARAYVPVRVLARPAPGVVRCQTTDGHTRDVPTTRLGDAVDARTLAGEVADFAKLSAGLNEAAILHCLRVRHARRQPFTAVGMHLVAVNPLEWRPHLYSPDVLRRCLQDAQAARGAQEGAPGTARGDRLLPADDAAPHLFTVSIRAFQDAVAGGRHVLWFEGAAGAGASVRAAPTAACGTDAAAAAAACRQV